MSESIPIDWGKMREPAVVINGILLSEGQRMSVRVAIDRFAMELDQEPDILGTDEIGRAIARGYLARLREVQRYFFL